MDSFSNSLSWPISSNKPSSGRIKQYTLKAEWKQSYCLSEIVLSYAGLFVKFCCSCNPSHLFCFVQKCLTRGRRFKLSNQKEMNLENVYKREEKKEKISLEEAIQLQLLKQIAIKNFQVNEVLEQCYWIVNICFLSRWSMWDWSVKFQQRSQ